MKEESFKQVILSTTFCEVLHFSESPQMREFHLTNSRWWMSFRDGILLQTPILFNDMQISNIGEACTFILILMKINTIEIPVCPFNYTRFASNAYEIHNLIVWKRIGLIIFRCKRYLIDMLLVFELNHIFKRNFSQVFILIRNGVI